jgi:uridine nucleosidase
LEGISTNIKNTWKDGSGDKVTMISTGPMTNIALFASVYPELLNAVEEFVFMGGGVGMGNRSAVAEYNILCDRESVQNFLEVLVIIIISIAHAAQIVLNIPVKKTMIPINVTHSAIVTRKIHERLLDPASDPDSTVLPKPATNLRHTLSTLISFFADSYKNVFGFNDGPPLHDALTIAYVVQPDLFQAKRYRVAIELTGTHSLGETVVDIWKYTPCDDTWGRDGRNCLVAESLNVNSSNLFYF